MFPYSNLLHEPDDLEQEHQECLAVDAGICRLETADMGDSWQTPLDSDTYDLDRGRFTPYCDDLVS